jgi:hypothetical protein
MSAVVNSFSCGSENYCHHQKNDEPTRRYSDLFYVKQITLAAKLPASINPQAAL